MSKVIAEVVTSYVNMKWWRDGFLNDDGPQCLVVIGSPGTGKSQLFRTTDVDKNLYLSGALSAFHLYTQLYHYRFGRVTIDDVDSLFKDKAAINLLKCACNLTALREIFWGKYSKQLETLGIPQRFTISSRICILANTLTSMEANLAAVLDRAFVISFEPTVEEVHREVGNWFKDEAVYNFIGAHQHLITQPSMRLYQKAADLRRMGGEWQDWLIRQWTDNDAALALVGRILNDASLASAADRVKRFTELGGGSRATFMRKQAEWRRNAETSRRNVA